MKLCVLHAPAAVQPHRGGSGRCRAGGSGHRAGPSGRCGARTCVQYRGTRGEGGLASRTKRCATQRSCATGSPSELTRCRSRHPSWHHFTAVQQGACVSTRIRARVRWQAKRAAHQLTRRAAQHRCSRSSVRHRSSGQRRRSSACDPSRLQHRQGREGRNGRRKVPQGQSGGQ
jgi:hypothetical protein